MAQPTETRAIKKRIGLKAGIGRLVEIRFLTEPKTRTPPKFSRRQSTWGRGFSMGPARLTKKGRAGRGKTHKVGFGAKTESQLYCRLNESRALFTIRHGQSHQPHFFLRLGVRKGIKTRGEASSASSYQGGGAREKRGAVGCRWRRGCLEGLPLSHPHF